MPVSGPRPGQVAVQVSLAAIFVSLELSRSTWLIASLVSGGRDKMSKHSLHSGDTAGLLNHLTTLRDKAHARVGASFPIIVIQEAGLDGFWVHRVLNRNRWSPQHVAQRLLLLLVQAFTPEGPWSLASTTRWSGVG